MIFIANFVKQKQIGPSVSDPSDFMKLKTILVTASVLLFGASAVKADIEEVSALIDSGRLEEASALLSDSKDPSRYLWQGRIAFLNFDFPEATRLYGQYRKALGKASPASEYNAFSRQLSLANQALESVARIEVIDSLTVDSSSFLSAIRLPASAGRLAEPDEIPIKGRAEIASMVFFNERGDFSMWAEPDTTGVYRITESSRLVDGSWSEPRLADAEVLNNGGDADYPFMCADGTTLYYASDGEESLGGFDLFIASRDPSDGEYLKPRNLGMPFNSPYDDFMMAVDEENGVGWWVTDRNRLGDKVTVYVYKLNDSRTNIDPEDEDLVSLARLDYISLTRDEETDYSALRRQLASIRPQQKPKPAEFRFNIPGRGVITAYSDLRNGESRQLMKQYQEALAKDAKEADRLRELRMKYRNAVGSGGREALKREILELESRRSQSEKALKALRNEIYKIEQTK